MSGLKICAYAIAKNEEQFVKRFCDSTREADLTIIADTGSTDRTVKEAIACDVDVFDISINPWRFDHARTAALALVPADVDVCISIDLDEVLEPGWRKAIEAVWTPQTTRLRYFYDWGSGIKFKAEKIHARHGYYWHHPCHEYPRPDGRITEDWAETDAQLITHLPDETKSRGQYLDLLALSIKEDPRCPRNAFYYARELIFKCNWSEGIVALDRYLNMPEATWVSERSYAMRMKGRALQAQGLPAEAERWRLRAAAESPLEREPWHDLASQYYCEQRWQDCLSAALRTLSITHRNFTYLVDVKAWGASPHDLAAIASWHLGFKAEAFRHGENALALEPDNTRLKSNLDWYKGEIK